MAKKLPKSVVDHPLFPKLVPFLKIEKYARDGGTNKPRRRLEIRTSDMPMKLQRQMLEMKVACVRCGAAIHPFRPRLRGSSNRTELPRCVYLAVACPLDVNIGCSRGKAAKQAYIDIESAALALG